MTADTALGADVPFLGLHYFDERQAGLFFGRDEQLRDMLAKLTGARLVTVIGSSGTGKSSLVRAAVFPALREGFLTDLHPRWRIVTMFPGSSPIANLAAALETEFKSTGIEVTLRRGRLGLLEAAQQCGLGEDENLLVFVDQFEEIFRYQRVAADRAAATDEASAFVQMLLEATAAAESSVYAIVTMRSDYLGACAQFRHLPERINTGLYLIPRMRRDHLEDAITGPAAVMGAAFCPPLVQRLLNDVGEDLDQLPVLQHALLRTWVNWKADERQPPEIDFPHYEATGGVRDSINNHAEEIYAKFDERDQRIVETIFKALTERDPANLDIRRPTPAGVIASIAKVPFADVARVAMPFRDEGVAFLRPSVKLLGTQAPARALTPETQLDITHESLIRKWYRLGGSPPGSQTVTRGWVHDEAELRDVYRDLAKRARAGTPLTGADLDAAITWRASEMPREWALRYDGDPDSHDRVLRYIEASERTRDTHRRRTRWVRAGAALAIVAILLAAVAAMESRRDATRQSDLRQQAEEFQQVAAARQLSAQAEALRDQDARPELSALLAIEAISRSAIPEASGALRWPLELLLKARWSKDASFQPASAAEEDAPGDDSLLRFSENGRFLALLASGDGMLHVYDVADGKEPALPPLPGKPMSIAWSGDELRVLVAPGGKQTLGPTQLTVVAIPAGGRESRRILEMSCLGCRDALLTRDGTRLLVDAESRVTAHALAGGPPQPLTTAVAAVDGALMLRRVDPEERPRPNGTRERFSLWRDGRPIGEIEGGAPRRPQVDLGTTSNVLAVAGRDGQIRIYRKEPALTLAGQVITRGAPTAFALSPDGTLLAIGNDSGEVRVMKWTTERARGGWSHQARIASVAFAPDGKSVASLDETGALRLVPLDAAEPDESVPDWVPLALDEQQAAAWTFARRGRFVLARSAAGPDVFDTRTGRTLLEGERPALLEVSAEGTFAAALFADGRLTVTDLAANTAATVPPMPLAGRPRTLAISPQGHYVAIRTDGGLHVVNVAKRAMAPLDPAVAAATAPVFSADGRWLAAYRPGADQQSATAMLVDAETWTVAGTWQVGAPLVLTVFSGDGRSLALRGTGGQRDALARTYRYIDIASKKERPAYVADGTTLLLSRFSPDGTRVAIATRDAQHATLRIFDAHSGTPIASLLLDNAPSTVAISGRNHYVGTVSSTGGIQIFELATGREVSRATLRDNENASHLRFSDDEQSIEFLSTWTSPSDEFAQTSREFGIRRVHLTSDLLLKDACQRVARALTREEWKKYLPGYEYRDTCKAVLAPAR
jgi:WD40 repeat protein